MNHTNLKSFQIALDHSTINSKLIVLLPQDSTTSHHHHEVEIWHILSGEGKIKSGDKDFLASAGDTLLFQPLQEHSIKNLSPTSELHFISLWYNDVHHLNKAIANKLHAQKEPKQNIFILPSFPTPNGGLHLGHLAGPYIAADIYKRYQQMIGNKAACLLGTVGHQSQVACKGDQLGLSFSDTAERFSDDIQETLAAAHIFPEVFIKPTTAVHYKNLTQQFFTTIYQQGHVKFKTKETLYCETCQKYLFEAHVSGICPYCNSNGASSNECEVCAALHEDKALINPCCITCRQPAVLKNVGRFYFPLEPFRERLTQYYQSIGLSTRLRAFINQVFQNKLIEFPISHLSDYGIPVPLVNHQQRLYSLVELAPRYICAIQALIDKNQWNTNWETLIKTYSTTLFFGFDNAFLRAIIFPALLVAYDPSLPLPQRLISNEFYKLEGKKFSTSRNHAIWGKDLLTQYPADLVRFYLAYTRPEYERSDFTMEQFQTFVQENIVSTLQVWVQALDLRLQKHYNNSAPVAGLWGEEAQLFYEELNYLVYKINQSYLNASFSLPKICRYLLSLIQKAYQFGQITENLCNIAADKNSARTHVSLELMAARSLVLLIYPIMPKFSGAVWTALGYQQDISHYDPRNCLAWVAGGQKITSLNQFHLLDRTAMQ